MNIERFNMTEEELERFFNKYNVLELESFSIIFNFVHDHDIKDILKVAKKVYKEKYSENAYKNETRHKHFNNSKMIKKNGILTEKELDLLYKLTESGVIYLSNIKGINVNEELLDMILINESVRYELSIRKNEKEKVMQLRK